MAGNKATGALPTSAPKILNKSGKPFKSKNVKKKKTKNLDDEKEEEEEYIPRGRMPVNLNDPAVRRQLDDYINSNFIINERHREATMAALRVILTDPWFRNKI